MRAQGPITAAAALLAAAAVTTGCGGDDSTTATQPGRPAKPPPGFRTVANEAGGFTVAVPRSWRTRRIDRSTRVRSPGRLAAITITPDRTAAGRNTPPSQYARQTLEALPELEGSVDPEGRQVRGTPYSSALVRARGTIASSPRQQEIAVAALHIPDRVTFAATIFGVGRPRTVERILASIRAGGAR